ADRRLHDGRRGRRQVADVLAAADVDRDEGRHHLRRGLGQAQRDVIDERSASAARAREAGSTRGSSRPFARRLHGFIAPSGWDADADASPRRPPPDPTAIRSSVLSTSSIPVAGGFNHLEHLAPNLLPWYGDRPATPKILTPSLRSLEPSHFDLVHGRTV